MARIDVERLRRALDELPALERRVYMMSGGEGLDHRVIAGMLGIGVADVEAALASALVGLGRMLED